jgi:hypothetical protein
MAELSSLRSATSADRGIIGEMASCFAAGTASLMVERFTGIEHGRPDFTIRSDDAVPRRAASRGAVCT